MANSIVPSVEDITIEELTDIILDKKIAYCFGPDNWTLLVSHSGHGKMLRGRAGRWSYCGGWAELSKGRIWDRSGSVKNVPREYRELVRKAFEMHYGVTLRWPQG